jgi:hypothetical protein
MASATSTPSIALRTTTDALVAIHLLALPGACWRCSGDVVPLVGVLVPASGGTRFIDFVDVAQRLREAVPDSRLRALGIGPIRHRRTRLRPDGYLANACVHCDAVLGEHPLREDLSTFLAEGGRYDELSIGQLLLRRRSADTNARRAPAGRPPRGACRPPLSSR